MTKLNVFFRYSCIVVFIFASTKALSNDVENKEYVTHGQVTTDKKYLIKAQNDGFLNLPLKTGGKFKKGDVLFDIESLMLNAMVKKLDLEIKALELDNKFIQRKVTSREKLRALRGKDLEDIQDLEHQLQSIDIEIELKKMEKKRTSREIKLMKIKARHSGYVIDHYYNHRDFVEKGDRVLSIIYLEPKYAEFNIPQDVMAAINASESVDFLINQKQVRIDELDIYPNVQNKLANHIIRYKFSDESILVGSRLELKVLIQ